MESVRKETERIDDLQRNGLKIIQDSRRFCFGMDAVLLSGFAYAGEGDRVCDFGTGTGILPILMSAKTKAEHFTGLEIQPESADMAKRSVLLNHLEERISIVEGDIKKATEIFRPSSFQVITCNPPYMPAQHGLVNEYSAKTIARHEVCCNLEDVLQAAEKLLAPGGKLFLVHRPFRLAEILSKMAAHRLEPKRLRMVYPFVDKEPNMVLIEGARGGNPGMQVEKPLILFEAPGVYTREIREDYGF